MSQHELCAGDIAVKQRSAVCVSVHGAPAGSLSLGLKAWMAEGRLGSPRRSQCGDGYSALSGWSLPLLWNWKLHK